MYDGEAAVAHRAAYGVHVLVEAVEVSFGGKFRYDGTRMASSAVGDVDVRAAAGRVYGILLQACKEGILLTDSGRC